jgi:adenine-specific DNA methylase
MLEYVPKFGKKLADEVRKWGEWIKLEAEKELEEFYPKDIDGAYPIAYLWARTILSEGPGYKNAPIEVPLIRSFWLAKGTKQKIALRWVRDKNDRVKTVRVEVNYSNGKKLMVRRPVLEIFSPKKESEVEDGTVARGSATCPVTGFTTAVTSVRKQLKKRSGGTNDARLFCIVTKRGNTRGCFYRLPTEKDLLHFKKAEKELHQREKKHEGDLSLVPDESNTEYEMFNNSTPLYGMNSWGALFNKRQALSLSTLVKKVREVGDQLSDKYEEELALAVQTCLAFAVDRQADYQSSLVVWANSGEFIAHTFGRQALPIVWEWPECNPWGNGSGNWKGAIDWIARVIESNITNGESCIGYTEQASATNHPLPDDSAHLFFTDPPYYYSVQYAGLSDFFYVWLKRSVGHKYPNLFQDDLSPKTEEIIVSSPTQANAADGKNNIFFEKQMQLALSEGRRICRTNGVGVVVFAQLQTSAWEAFLQSLVDAGWIITASWPIDTERPGRILAARQSVLGSSIHLVCRPRKNADSSDRVKSVGDWRDVLVELPKRIHEWMPKLAKEGVVGADAIFSCLGPALEIFSRYSSVEKASGEEVQLKEYLEQVWAAVAKEALNMIFQGADASGFEEDARLTAMWLWTLRTSVNNNKESNGKEGKAKSIKGYTLEFDAARKIAQGLGAHLENLGHLVEIKADKATLLSAGSRIRHLFGKDSGDTPKLRKKKLSKQMQFNFTEDTKQVKEESVDWSRDLSGKLGGTVLDQLHQSMILFDAGRGEALRRFLIEDGVGRNPLYWRLAQALSALYPSGTEEKRWVDGVLARKKSLGF